MNAAEAALAAGRAALAADRPLSREEFDGVRAALNDANTDAITRGALRGLGEALEKQSNARIQAQRSKAVEEGAREAGRRAQERREAWRALDPMLRAAFLSGDQKLIRFAELVVKGTDSIEPAPDFMPERL